MGQSVQRAKTWISCAFSASLHVGSLWSRHPNRLLQADLSYPPTWLGKTLAQLSFAQLSLSQGTHLLILNSSMESKAQRLSSHSLTPLCSHNWPHLACLPVLRSTDFTDSQIRFLRFLRFHIHSYLQKLKHKREENGINNTNNKRKTDRHKQKKLTGNYIKLPSLVIAIG